MSRWLCLLSGGLDESVIDAYVQDGFTVILGPDHPGLPTHSPISLIALEPDGVATAQEARRLWEALGELSTEPGRSLRDDLTKDHVSLWDVCATNIILYYFQKICRNVSCVDRLFETHDRPECIVVDGGTDLAAGWLTYRAEADGIPFEILGSRRTRPRLAAYREGLHERLRRWRNRIYATLSLGGTGGQSEALFLGLVDRQLDSMIPVAKALREHEGIAVRFLVPISSSRRAELRDEGFRCDVYEAFTPWVANKLPPVDHILSLIDDDPVCQAYSSELRPRLRRLLVRAAEYRSLARSIRERLRPSLLVTSDVNHPLLRSLCLDAAQAGVPSINIPYGVVCPRDVEWSFIPQTVAAVLGSRSVEAITSWGVGASRIEICGSPRHDAWVDSPNPAQREQERTSLRLPLHDKIICYLSVPADLNRLASQDGAVRLSEKTRMLIAVRDASLEVNEGFLMVVAHPEESLEDLQRTLGPCDPKRIRVVRARSIRRLLEVSDVAVTCHSMAGLEAILLGVPLVTVNLSGRTDPVPYAEDGGATGVYQAQQLLPALEAALVTSAQHDGRKQFLDKHLHLPPEGAARLIAKVGARVVSAPDAIGATSCG